MPTLQSLKDDIDDRIKDEFVEMMQDRYYQDRFHEMADGLVPIYYRDRAEVLMDDPSLEIQDSGLAEGKSTIMDLIGVAIYEELTQRAYEYFEELKTEYEDKRDEAESDGYTCEKMPGLKYCILDEREHSEPEEGCDDCRPVLVQECDSEEEAWVEFFKKEGNW